MVTKKLRDRYTLLETLKQSDSTTVYKAMDKTDGIPVVLKLIKADDLTPITGYRTDLYHKNIVRCMDIIHYRQNNSPYICFVLEWLNGLTLRESLLKRQIRITVRFLLQLLEGVNHLHQHGIVHGDIKPDNIMVIQEDSEPIPKLIDYASKINVPGAFFVTPAHAPPEYAKSADLWAIGCILYEILTRQHAFAIDSSGMLKEDSLLFPFKKIAPLPEPFRYICFKCLRFDKKERFKDAVAIINILQNKNRIRLKFKILRDYLVLKK